MPLPSLDEAQTNKALAILSLDLARPYLADLGLPLGEQALPFQQALRLCFAQLRQQVQQQPDSLPDVAGQAVQALLQAGLEPQARELWAWAPGALLGQHAAQPQLSGWDIALHQWAWPPAQPELPLAVAPVAALAEAAAQHYRQRLQALDLRPRLAATREQALSDWDLGMFARHGWAESEYSHPAGTLRALVQGRAAIDAWHHAAGRAAPDVQRALAAHADATLRALGAWMPGPLLPLGPALGLG